MTTIREQMVAAHEGNGRFRIEGRPAVAGAGESLVRVLATGICGTDLAIAGDPPEFFFPDMVLGHEIVGEVVEGPDRGRLVVVDPNVACGHCGECWRHRPSACTEFAALGIHRPGGFAEYVVAPSANVLPVNPTLHPHTAVLAEPLACALHGLAAAPSLEPAGSAVVLGAGPIGAMFSLLLERGLGQRVIVSEPLPERRRWLTSRLEYGKAVDPSELTAALEDVSTRGAPLIVDAVGGLLPQATALVSPGGHVVLFGMADGPSHQFQRELTIKQATVTGVFLAGGSFPAAIGILERGIVTAEDLVCRVAPLTDLELTLPTARYAPGRVLIDPAGV